MKKIRPTTIKSEFFSPNKVYIAFFTMIIFGIGFIFVSGIFDYKPNDVETCISLVVGLVIGNFIRMKIEEYRRKK